MMDELQKSSTCNHDFLKYKIVSNTLYRGKFTNLMVHKQETNNAVYRQFKTQKLISTIFEGMCKVKNKDRAKSQASYTKGLAQSRVKTDPSIHTSPYGHSYSFKGQ